jgi:hypothetical protein
MAKRSLYAAAEMAASLAVAAITVFPASAQAGRNRGDEAVCAACVAIAVDAATAPALPQQLQGVEVFVRVPGGKEGDAASTLDAIERAGGRPALLIDGWPMAALPPAVARRAGRIVIDPGRRPADVTEDQFAFRMKTAVSALRGALPDTARIGLAGDVALLSSLLSRNVGFYLDFLVAVDDEPFSITGIELWRTIPASVTSLDRALTASNAAAAQHWLWMLPPDPSIAGTLAGKLARAKTTPVASDTPQSAATDTFVQDVEVVASRSLTVAEIVARHQAASARQAAAVRTVIANGTLTLSFEAPGFPAPVTVSSEVRMYTAEGVTDIEQREVRINGVEFRANAVPRLPIIEPERVASPPLAIALTDVYRYRLAGRETIAGTPCYVVAFEPDPVRAGRSSTLFRGRAWIATDGFGMVKVAATQTGLVGAIVASEQTDEFRQVQDGVWLLARSDVRQMYEGAAHRTPIHRVLALRGDEINAPDFRERRQFAYRSASVMLRDTAQGYRYLKKEDAAAESLQLAGSASRVRTIAAGVILDPNISIPLPFAGFSYVDFNFLGTGTQLNTFFGGTYGQLAFAVPSLGGSRWQLAGRGFAIASSYYDRSFEQGREQYAENLEQRPAQASVWVVRPLTARVSLRFGYDLDYTHLAASDATAASFVVPADQVVHGARISLDVQRAGWNGSAWWNPARRSGWRAWGQTASSDYQPSQQSFQRYGLSISRAHVFDSRTVARLEGAWMGGGDLDRFSRYSFGTFENRLRGYPSALIRYDRGAVLRTVVAHGFSRMIRVDGFFDTAAVHDPGFGGRLRNYTGVGAAVEMPSPFGTLMAVEWGYGFRGVNGNGTLGTQVVRISGYKVF